MEVSVNGQCRTFESPLTLQELLQRLELSVHGIAVAVNGQVIPRSELAKQAIEPQDRVEILHPVGGG